MSIPLGPVMKAWNAASAARCGRVHHLPRLVDVSGLTQNPTQRAEIGHAHAIGPGDKSMGSLSGHLSSIVDGNSFYSAKVPHPHPIRASDESMRSVYNRVIATNQLSRTVDVIEARL